MLEVESLTLSIKHPQFPCYRFWVVSKYLWEDHYVEGYLWCPVLREEVGRVKLRPDWIEPGWRWGRWIEERGLIKWVKLGITWWQKARKVRREEVEVEEGKEAAWRILEDERESMSFYTVVFHQEKSNWWWVINAGCSICFQGVKGLLGFADPRKKPVSAPLSNPLNPDQTQSPLNINGQDRRLRDFVKRLDSLSSVYPVHPFRLLASMRIPSNCEIDAESRVAFSDSNSMHGLKELSFPWSPRNCKTRVI